ncbi:type II secretion system protein F (GspF) [Mobilisporobacter senegalensis]|uniref:Type II secretion system protein F (GspF) n=1 Tax=Mobilisporobacter senegalensis TaxID=1329262 RepID=A0A3N1XU45_9FIRM|nr:type II secretion system F family protein [Mobilisporobacter senegalensis]ROR28702.1 type II secretion system protein F (GspF) [Mobilisporobacter senegalensis]
MFLELSSIIILGIGTVLAIIFIILIMMSGKYRSMTEPLSEKEYPLHDIYGAGFIILDLLHYQFQSKRDYKRRQAVELLYEVKYSDYYMRVIAAQRITLSALLALAGFAVFGITNDITILLLLFGFSALAFYYFGIVPEEKIKKRSNEILSDFPDVVSKLALLINAGMIMKEAWKKVAEGGKGALYDEMRITMEEMDNGVSELDAYYNFSLRCVVPEIKKFTSTVMQGLVKGNREFSLMIKQQSKEIWDVKKHHVKQQGEKAASKLMIPISIIFLGIIIMIIVPIFSNLGV